MSPDFSHDDRRRSPRLPVTLPVRAGTDTREVSGLSINLSLGGAYLLLNGGPSELDAITLELTLPVLVDEETGPEEFEITCHGVVVRVEPWRA